VNEASTPHSAGTFALRGVLAAKSYSIASGDILTRALNQLNQNNKHLHCLRQLNMLYEVRTPHTATSFALRGVFATKYYSIASGDI